MTLGTKQKSPRRLHSVEKELGRSCTEGPDGGRFDEDGAVFTAVLNLAEFQQADEQPRRQWAGQMSAALCPVRAGPGVASSVPRRERLFPCRGGQDIGVPLPKACSDQNPIQ